ncbi:hypothetical protein BC835DRAFT_492599 [Cytidiella melzeri]|nr:hypothetical protein BC835DRAFT_492599 [Cytidiella melzeri]
MPNSSAPYIHSGDPAYAPPVLRAPSPSSSIGTDYGPDETTPEEARMTEVDFLRQLKLADSRNEEHLASQEPLLPKPKDAQHESFIMLAVMKNLRKAVQKLQDDELFEQRILRGSLVTGQEQVASGDIDSIMRSMMNLSPSVPSAPSTAAATNPPPTPSNGGPTAADLSFGEPISMGPPPLPGAPFFNLGSDMNPMTSTPGRRSTRLKLNTRKP